MSQPTDACPSCGEHAIVAVCAVIVEYAVANEGEADQDWSRREVDDDTSEPTHFRCDSCGEEFHRFALDAQGYLVRLGPSPTQAAPDADAMTAEGFRAWLTSTVAAWCRGQGLTPGGEGLDCGDLYRALDDADAFGAIGVTLVPAYEEGVLFVVGPGAAWLATTGIELGIEGETVWFDPLTNLRLDVPLEDLVRFGEGLRRRADEVADLLAGTDESACVSASACLATWAYCNEDNDLMVFLRTYPTRPTEDRVRRDGYHSLHQDDEAGQLDEAAYQAWHDALCQPGQVTIIPLR